MCCTKAKCLKFFIFSTNVVFFVVGIGLLTAVSKAVTDVGVFTHFIKIDMALRVVYNGMYILVAAGLILFLTGFLGCFGAIRENRYLLCMFVFVVISLMLLEVSGFLIIFINYPNQKSFLLSTMDLYQNEEILTPCQEIENPDKRTICFYEMKIKQEESNWVQMMKNEDWKRDRNLTDLIRYVGSPIVTTIWDQIQANNECCGINGADDWIASDFGKVPEECCLSGNQYSRIEIANTRKQVNRTYCKPEDEGGVNFIGCEIQAKGYAQVTGIFFIVAFIAEMVMVALTCAFIKETSQLKQLN